MILQRREQNGRQRKSYMYVQDCIDAMLLAFDKVTDKKLLEKVKFPLVTEEQLADTLAKLAEEAAS